MAGRQPISTAPTDGSKITVFWTDVQGQENRTIARYRSADQLERSGGQWDAAEVGWWAFVDDDTQKRIRPDAWLPEGAGDED